MSPNDTSGRSIALVVDDNPESLGMVATALEQEGMTVLVARDGASAIKLTYRVQPDVILMDAVMPEMDGFDTCRALKTGSNAVLAPIIFMTGLTDQEHIVKGLRAGGVDYITKPVILDEMLARIATHVTNFKLIQGARDAVTSFGGAVLAFDHSAQVLWGAQKALTIFDNARDTCRTEELAHWLHQATGGTASSVFRAGALEFTFVCCSSAQEYLVQVSHSSGLAKEDVLIRAFSLTKREAEILYWLTLGKTNKDISVILELSARTVNKHLEQVFQKLGVDNRTSAAVLADRTLAQRV